MSDPTAIRIVDSGGTASAGNPPLDVTVWEPDGEGGFAPVTLGAGGGGAGTVQSVAGVAPDEAGNVPLGYADIGPIALGDLGFDPTTEGELDAELVTLNQQIATAGKFKGQYNGSAHSAGDVVVEGGELWRANTDIPANDAVVYVGGQQLAQGSSATTYTLPAGSAAGDRVVLYRQGDTNAAFPTPSGWTLVGVYNGAAITVGNGNSRMGVFQRVLTSGEVSAGTLERETGETTYKSDAIRVFRNAGTPSVAEPVFASLPTSSDSATTLQVPARTPAPGSRVVRTLSLLTPGNYFSGSASITGDVEAGTLYQPTPPNGYVRQASALLNPGSIEAADGVLTIPAGNPGSQVSVLAVDIDIPAGSFNSAQWTKISRVPKRVSVADANYVADGTEDVIAYTSLTAYRNVTLPLASAYGVGRVLTIVSQSANVGVLITRSGSDTFAWVAGTQTNAITTAYGAIQIVSTGTGWAIVQPSLLAAELAGKLSADAGAVGITNLAESAKPALAVDNGNGNTAIPAGSTQRTAFDTGTAVTLPSASAHGSGRFLLVRTMGSGGVMPTNPVSFNRAGSDTIGPAGATSLTLTPDIPFALLRSNGLSPGRWDIIAGAEAPGSRHVLDTTGLSSAQIDTALGSAAVNGAIVDDRVNHLILRRDGGAWYRSAALTAV